MKHDIDSSLDYFEYLRANLSKKKKSISKDLVSSYAPGGGNELLKAVTDFVNLMLNGEMPGCTNDVIFGDKRCRRKWRYKTHHHW